MNTINTSNLMIMVKTGLAITAIAAMSACASSPSKMSATYVSPVPYSGYTCEQIQSEMDGIDSRCKELYASLEKEANIDKVQVAVGALVFWPALLFVEGGDGPEALEYKELLGKAKALESVAKDKQCKIDP